VGEMKNGFIVKAEGSYSYHYAFNF